MNPPSDPAKPPTGRLERINYRLKHSPLIEFLEYAGKLTVVAAVISGAWSGIKWQLEADDRDKERHYRAWELVNSARGSTGDGGRRDALEDLNRDKVSLAAAPLEQAYLLGIDLNHSDLWSANLQGAQLEGANLEHANLESANLENATLGLANLQGAELTDANLEGAELAHANLQGSILVSTDLQKARLGRANLQGTDLKGANLQGARNLTQVQLDATNGNSRTVLPAGLTRPAHWAKAEVPETPPPAQPDAAERAPAAVGAPGSDK